MVDAPTPILDATVAVNQLQIDRALAAIAATGKQAASPCSA